jgi:methionyl-tRNA synthetase
MTDPKRYLVTSALPYANGPLHIGHLTGAYLPADIFVRFLRLMGKEVLWVCGSDEHGAAITVRARKENSTPQAIVDKYDAQFRATFAGMGIAFDIFHRTSSPLHHETTREFFRTLFAKGAFEEQTSEQYFDPEAQQFLADRFIVGVCPVCANPDAYGDQCERCGSTLSPDELLAPIRSTLSDATPEKRSTKHWFLTLDKSEAWLRRWIEQGEVERPDGSIAQLHDPSEWKAHVIGQCRSWLDGGLHPRAMTRDLEWGIAVPEEIDASGTKKIYVWMDAPIGYISATRQWAINEGDADAWKKYWQSDDSALIHFIGKDNIVFHCLIFPAILQAHGGYVLPKNVPANQFMNLEGKKISTSRNWAVWVHEYLADFPDRQDELRYNMLKNMPEQSDSEFTWRRFQELNNTELVNNLANFINRVVVLVNKYYAGATPEIDKNIHFLSGIGAHTETNYAAEIARFNAFLNRIETHILGYEFRAALLALMEFSSFGNQLLQANEPWKAFKTNPIQTATVLNVALQIVAALGVAMRPFMPFTSDKIRAMLRQDALMMHSAAWAAMRESLAAERPLLVDGHQIGEPLHLFTRITDEVIEAQIAKLEAAQVEQSVAAPTTEIAAPTFEPLKTEIQYDDFAKMDIRTGIIRAAAKVPKADKLLQLTIDLGFETRTIVSGIAEHFAPEAIIGQSVLVLANLAPRKLRGIESQGMILMAEDVDQKLHFVRPDDHTLSGGFSVR